MIKINEKTIYKICLNCRHFIHGIPEWKEKRQAYYLCGPNSSIDTIIKVKDSLKNKYLMGCTKVQGLIFKDSREDYLGECPIECLQKMLQKQA